MNIFFDPQNPIFYDQKFFLQKKNECFGKVKKIGFFDKQMCNIYPTRFMGGGGQKHSLDLKQNALELCWTNRVYKCNSYEVMLAIVNYKPNVACKWDSLCVGFDIYYAKYHNLVYKIDISFAI